MAYFEQCLTQYNRTPVFSDIFKLLIKQEDAEKLQKGKSAMLTTCLTNFHELAYLDFKKLFNGSGGSDLKVENHGLILKVLQVFITNRA